MRLNNRGFAISTIMYMILIMAIILITLTLTLLSSRKLILDKTKQETKEIIYSVIETVPEESILPEEYQQVEYLESTGTQYIDTGVQHVNYPSFSGKFKKTTSDAYTVFGVYGAARNKAYLTSSKLQWGTHNNPTAYYGNSYGGPIYIIAEEWHSFEFRYGYIKIDSQEKTFTKDFNSSTYTYVLFGKNNAGTIEPSILAISEFKIYVGAEEQELIRDFIPCYRKEDKVAGMYDIVNDVFYTNAGTGEFVIGPKKR